MPSGPTVDSCTPRPTGNRTDNRGRRYGAPARFRSLTTCPILIGPPFGATSVMRDWPSCWPLALVAGVLYVLWFNVTNNLRAPWGSAPISAFLTNLRGPNRRLRPQPGIVGPGSLVERDSEHLCSGRGRLPLLTLIGVLVGVGAFLQLARGQGGGHLRRGSPQRSAAAAYRSSPFKP